MKTGHQKNLLRIASACISMLVLTLTPPLAGASDPAENWPMWRYDSHRSAASPNSVPESLEVLWKVSYPERIPAWDDPLNQDLMTFDRVFEPIVMDGRLFLGFNDSDKLVALDTNTGAVLWSFFAEAPIRLAPVAWRDRLFVCSDDGFLYCLRSATGELIWKFRGGPDAQHALGNRRLVSAWPARGGPVLHGNTIYFAASIWPFMGTFIYAMDADTGSVQWVNDSTGAQYIKQPHSAPSFAGVGPQGALVATEEYLIVPGGRSVPAVFRRSTGEFLHFEINAGGKGTGGSFVAADAIQFYVHTREKGTRAFNMATGVKTAFMPNEPAILDTVLFASELNADGQRIVAYQAGIDDDRQREILWSLEVPSMDDLIVAGGHLVAAGEGKVTVVELPVIQDQVVTGGKVVRQIDLSEKLSRLVVADHKIFAVADSGTLYALGNPLSENHSSEAISSSKTVRAADPKGGEAAVSAGDTNAFVTGEVELRNESALEEIEHLMNQGPAEGYAFWFGECPPDILAAWARTTPFVQLAIVDSDSSRVDRARRMLDALGVYGRITVHLASPADFKPPSYIANMVFVDSRLAQLASTADWNSMYSAVRPYGGALVVRASGSDSAEPALAEMADRLESMQFENARVNVLPTAVTVQRVGALPGSADWTHQHGDIANTVKSNDSRARLPLGILWFGGNSNLDVLPRHGHGPPQQIVAGRLIIQGMSSLSARDVYTGRVLWHRDFGDLGTFDVYYDQTYEDAPLNPQYNQVHIPGANARGTNYVVTDDLVYLIIGNRCQILDVVTGEDRGEIAMPRDEAGNDPEWGFIGVYQDVLLGGVGFAKYRERLNLEFPSDRLLKDRKAGFSSKSLDRAASRALIGFDRHSGKQLWRVDANHSFWHNGIVAGGSKVYCLDRNPALVEQALQRRGLALPDSYRILAVDYRTGNAEWEVRENIFGTWLGYSEQHDLLLQAGARASDRLIDETGNGMRVYNAADGSLRWAQDELEYNGPCILHNDWIITNTNSYSRSAGAYDVRTGKQRMSKNPITGQLQPWQITRTYGCNKIIASENLLTFRSGAAGFYDLLSESGTGNWGGFKSGCTSNLIVANGLLNAPDYTRTCSCAYQNQTSLALVHMPNVDLWTVNLSATEIDKGLSIEALGVNFGAPGNRRDTQGTLWVEHPCASGDPPPISITLNDSVQFFQHHSSNFIGSELPWVQSSGAVGATQVRVQLVTGKESELATDRNEIAVGAAGTDGALYRVDLFFGLPMQLKSDEVHQFEVQIAGQSESQIITLGSGPFFSEEPRTAVTGGLSKAAMCTFEAVRLGDELVISLKPMQGTPFISGVRLSRIE
jgi:outer membrane protein assembly factor BamB